MRIVAILSATLVALAAAGCSDGGGGKTNDGGSGGTGGVGGTGGTGGTGGVGGTGGIGGTGGTVEQTTCEAYCSVLEACGQAPANCVTSCEGLVGVPDELIAECGACFEALACSEWGPDSCEGECTGGLDLTVVLSGFGQWIGKPFLLSIQDGMGTTILSDSWIIGAADAPPVDFEQPLYGFAEAGDTLIVDYFVDVDANGVCNADDHAGHFEFEAIQDHVTVEMGPDVASNVEGCLVYADMPVDLRLTSTGFVAFHDQALYVSVVDAAGETVATANTVIGTGGQDDIDLIGAGLLTVGESYTVRYFIDGDADKLCTAADHAASVDITVTGHTTVEFSAEDVVDVVACEDFGWIPADLNVVGTGFEAYEGEVVVVSVIEIVDGARSVLGLAEATVTTGGFELPLPGALVADAAYEIAWLIDLDADGVCAPAPADIGGLVELTDYAGGNAEVTLTPAEEPTDASCAFFPGMGYDITVEGTGFNALEGARVEAYLADPATGELLDYAFGAVQTGTFSLLFEGQGAAGNAYEIYYFVDADGSLWCDGADPSGIWSETVTVVDGPVTATVTVPAAHDADACLAMNAYWGF